MGKLSHRFASPFDAEQFFRQTTVQQSSRESANPPQSSAVSLPPIQPAPPAPVSTLHGTPNDMQISMGSAFSPTGAMESCRTALAPFETGVKLDILSLLFSEVAKGFPMPDVPQDFLRLSMAAMHRLHTSGRSNTVYLLAKALGTMRADNSDSLLPVSRMPMGLLEYTIAFFAATSIQQVCI